MGVGLLVVAALWGFAEATLFFVVPDVLLTWMAIRRGVRPAFAAAGAAALGATLGGAVMVAWGAEDPAGSRAALDMVPAVGGAMIDDVAAGVSGAWLPALLEGAFLGVPYKIFAQQAGAQGLDAGWFLLATPFARFARFGATVLLAGALAAVLRRASLGAAVIWIWAAFWLLFYAVYWSVMPH